MYSVLWEQNGNENESLEQRFDSKYKKHRQEDFLYLQIAMLEEREKG